VTAGAGRRRPRRPKLRLALALLGLAVASYAIGAYLVVPTAWSHFERQKGLEGLPMLTRSSQGIPADPMNLSLVGSKEEVLCAMRAAAWYPADPITFRSSVGIIGSVLFRRPYPHAPVSTLYYAGRPEDLAFERPDGKTASRRNHVRFWQVLDKGEEGRAVWLGAATFDRKVGFNHYTGQVTHHIAPDIDAERDYLVDTLKGAKVVEAIYEVSGIGPTLNGRNGEDDPYYTDGEIKVLRLAKGCGGKSETVAELANPPAIDLKNAVWQNAVKALLSWGASSE
jgi:hypothetical protein